MKRFLINTDVVDAQGVQTWYVDAESEDEALEKFNAGAGEIYENEVEVTKLGDPEICGETTLDDFGDQDNGLTADAAEQGEQGQAVASIYITPSGEREFDDWKCSLPVGRNILYTTPPTPPAGVPYGWDEWERKTFDLAIEYAKAGVGMPQWEVLRDHVRSARTMLSAALQPAAQMQEVTNAKT